MHSSDHSVVRWQRRRHGCGLLALLAGALGLSACGSQPVRELEAGLLQVDCDGGYHDWSACHKAAARRCGAGGYLIVAQVSDEGGSVGTRDWSQEGSVVSRTLEFRCNAP